MATCPPFKVAVLVPDGAADLPLDELNGRTPLEAASIPRMDEVARLGRIGTMATVPPGMPAGSDVANLSLLGYDPRTHYGGRAPIEAANLGIEIPPGWTAFRCNLVSTDGERMLNYSAGHIGGEAAAGAVARLQEALGDAHTRFFPGRSYRNIVLVEGDFRALECTPPHDITGELLVAHLPRGDGAARIIDLMERSREALARSAGGGRPGADMIWLWGQGTAMKLEPFAELHGLEGAVISAVDLVCGLGLLAGLEVIEVPGITGYLDTNYRGKGAAAVVALQERDFVFVHVEATDEASHMGSIEEKVTALERFDEFVAGPVLRFLKEGGHPYRLAVCPDHPTLISTRTHDPAPVPYAACGAGIEPSGANSFSEETARGGGPAFDEGWRMMHHLTGAVSWCE
ncbi:MAG: cofactor-independent phosphoglycerate mutase [Actinomycetota bacterium]